MVNQFLQAIAWGFCFGIVAAVYRSLATEPFFFPWWQYGQRYENRWFFKPVWGCAHCAAGQLALWSYTFLQIVPRMVAAVRENGAFYLHSIHYAKSGFLAALSLIMAISAAIATAKILTLKFK